MRRCAPPACLLLLLTACGASDPAAGGDAGPLPEADARALADFVPLVQASWTLAPGEEGYYCSSVVLDQDVPLGGFVPVAPLGTHHTVVSLGDADTGEGWCDVSNLGSQWIYASGVGTGQLVFPPDTGLVLHAGTRVNLQLHLFNTTESPLSGTSGVSILPVASVRNEVNVFLPGSTSFLLPPHEVTSASGTCNITDPQTVLAIFPHMHQLGKHMKVELWRDGAFLENVWDADFAFGEQEVALVGPLALLPGDQLKTTCTWDNTNDVRIGWGDSSEAEMCFAITYRVGGGGGTSVGTFPVCGG